MRGHPVASQNSGNTFAVCFSDTSEIKKSSSVSEMVLWGVVFREKNFFHFDFDFALGNFDTKTILSFGLTKPSFDTKSILDFNIILKFDLSSNIYQFQNYR